MQLNLVKDILFELLNESDCLNIADIEANDKENILTVEIADGSLFEIECRKLKQQVVYLWKICSDVCQRKKFILQRKQDWKASKSVEI